MEDWEREATREIADALRRAGDSLLKGRYAAMEGEIERAQRAAVTLREKKRRVIARSSVVGQASVKRALARAGLRTSR